MKRSALPDKTMGFVILQQILEIGAIILRNYFPGKSIPEEQRGQLHRRK